MESEGALPGPALSPQVAAKILKADLVNLGRRVASGKSLNAAERALLQSVADGDEVTLATGWAKNQVELATALKVNRKTVQRWLKVEGNPGAAPDGRMNVPAWREWAKAHGHRFKDEERHDKAKLECEKLLKQNELLEIELQRRRGEVTENAQLEIWVAQMVGASKTVLLSLPGILAPQVVGLSVPEAEKRIREAIDEALTQLHREPWKGGEQ